MTWADRIHESATGFILVNEKARRQVKDMWGDESDQIEVISDYNMHVMTYECGDKGDKNWDEEYMYPLEGERYGLGRL